MSAAPPPPSAAPPSYAHGAYAPPTEPAPRWSVEPPPTAAPEPTPTGPDDDATEVRIVGVGAKVISPPWELELLISGALTLALLQGPDAFAAFVDARLRDSSGPLEFALVVLRFLGCAGLYTLLAAFLLNLSARAYWVGLVGLNTVFPQGVRWEAYRSGPFLRDVYRERLASIPRIIERVDGFASVVFSFAFLIVLIIGVAAATFGLVFALASAIAASGLVRASRAEVGLLLLTAASVPQLVFSAWDRWVGPRLAPDGRAARVTRRIARGAYLLNGAGLFGPIMVTLATNTRRRHFMPLFAGAVVFTLGAGLLDFLVRYDAFDAGNIAYIPHRAGDRGREIQHYESLRRDDRQMHLRPTIQSDIVTDPYVRLFVPYWPGEGDEVLPLKCPGVARLRPEGLHLRGRRDTLPAAERERRIDRVLACLAQMHHVALDGKALPGTRWRFSTHPVTRTEGIVAYVPVHTLAVGEHELQIGNLPHRHADGAWHADTTRIPFWR